MDVLLIVDMQEGLRLGPPKHDLDDVLARINGLARRVRDRGGRVVLIRHTGPVGDPFAPGAPGYAFLSGLEREDTDVVVAKTHNDAFIRTSLEATLRGLGPSRLLIAGWATDFCVDGTIRSAAALGFPVTAVADAHTVSDRPHLAAAAVIAHHHHIWTGLIAAHPVRLENAAEL